MCRRDTRVLRYVAATASRSRLTRAEEVELGTRWRTQRDRAAADRLVRAHVRWVVAIARKYRGYQIPLDELVAEGNFGLVCALERFEPERGIRFVTYATYWIRTYIRDYVCRCWSVVGGGAGPLRSRLFFRLRRELNRTLALVGEGEEAERLLVERLGMKSERIAQFTHRLQSGDLSLDTPAANGSERPLLDTLQSQGADQERALIVAELDSQIRTVMGAALNRLDPRERYVIEARLLADDDDCVSLHEVASRLHVSRQRIHQLELRAKRKLRAAISELVAETDPAWFVHDAA
jgi:RNA polymerase sigma-32 factor